MPLEYTTPHSYPVVPESPIIPHSRTRKAQTSRALPFALLIYGAETTLSSFSPPPPDCKKVWVGSASRLHYILELSTLLSFFPDQAFSPPLLSPSVQFFWTSKPTPVTRRSGPNLPLLIPKPIHVPLLHRGRACRKRPGGRMEPGHLSSLGLTVGSLCPHSLLQRESRVQKGPQGGVGWVDL